MSTARVLNKGPIQTVELPSDVRIAADVVEVVERDGDVVLLDPAKRAERYRTDWVRLFELLAEIGEQIGEAPEDMPPEDVGQLERVPKL